VLVLEQEQGLYDDMPSLIEADEDEWTGDL
jgi:hypothetical protein